MKVSKIIEGLQIIQKSKEAQEDDYHLRAEHDEIWSGDLEWEMSEADKNRMKELGWEADEAANGWRASV